MGLAPQTDVNWVTKREAARLLGVTERQIDRHRDAGRVRFERRPRQPHESQAPVFYRLDDLEAIQRGEPRYWPVVEKTQPNGAARDAGAPQSETSSASSPAVLPKAAAPPEWLMRIFGAASPAPPPFWLDLRAAAKYSGLTEGFLRRIAPVLEQRGDVIDVSPSPARHSWRFLRAALERKLLGD